MRRTMDVVTDDEKDFLSKFLKEDVSKDDLKLKVIDFLTNNPDPKDDKFHSFAEKNGLDPDDMEEIAYSVSTSFWSNGKFNESGKKEEDIDETELEMGIKVEAEHTNYPTMARRIALDHLSEIKDYYSRLKKMEADAGIKD